jgi:hypothetical protein
VAPVSEPPARGRFDPPADDTGLARPAVAVDPADDEALEALTLAVADRLAEQLVRAGDELGIEV